jgi:GNAT superfamily N-acetyltransferase
MLCRVRASLHERPGALALLATRCGEAGLNILGLQLFPDLGRVTDELVISTPEGWTAAAVAELVSGAGGDEVSVEPCTTHDLIDQPTRWLSAAQDAVADPALLPSLVERLLGPHPESWSATEHSRAAALTELVSAVVGSPPATPGQPVDYEESGGGVRARIGGHVVGAAAFDVEDPHELRVEVAPAWRRRGIGTVLLTRAAAQAAAAGAEEVVVLAPPGDEGFVAMVHAVGLRARLKVSDGALRARITVAGMRPPSPLPPSLPPGARAHGAVVPGP